MILKRAKNKIFITTISLFLLLVICSIPNTFKENSIRVNLELEEITSLSNYSIYLLNKDNYLVKKNIFIDDLDTKSKIYKILNYLKINNNSKYSSNLSGVIPNNCKINSVEYEDFYVTIDFSKELLEANNLDITITSIVYSIMELGQIKGISILIDKEPIEGYPYVLNKSMDINMSTFITSREDITKVVVYYLLKDNEETYYVPVTKYLNDSREKIEIIVDELASSTSTDLVSYVNSNLELLNSREDNDTFILNFNNFLFDNNDEVLEEVLYCISYSVFDNYDVDMVMVEVNGKNIKQIAKREL